MESIKLIWSYYDDTKWPLFPERHIHIYMETSPEKLAQPISCTYRLELYCSFGSKRKSRPEATAILDNIIRILKSYGSDAFYERTGKYPYYKIMGFYHPGTEKAWAAAIESINQDDFDNISLEFWRFKHWKQWRRVMRKAYRKRYKMMFHVVGTFHYWEKWKPFKREYEEEKEWNIKHYDCK